MAHAIPGDMGKPMNKSPGKFSYLSAFVTAITLTLQENLLQLTTCKSTAAHNRWLENEEPY